MSRIVKPHQPCKADGCGSSDAKAIYEDGSAFCFSCRKYTPPAGVAPPPSFTPDPKDDALYTRADSKILAVIENAACGPIASRKITAEVTSFFGVRVSYSPDRKDVKHAYPYDVHDGVPRAYKIREVADKQFKSVGKIKGLCGQHLFQPGGKRLVITEGEIDMLSVAQASLDHYKKIYPVISVRSATTVKADILAARDWIRSFNEVVICQDNDDPGKDATIEICKIIGYDKAKIATFGSLKDPNKVLMDKGSMALIQAIWDAQRYVPSGIITKDSLWDALCNYNEQTSIPYPPCVEGLNTKLKGMRKGEIDLFVSGTGCLGIDTPVLMFNGSLKAIQDIVVGDVLMGDDNTPRIVLELVRGTQEMFKVSISKNDFFTCNADHILSLKKSGTDGRYDCIDGDVVDVKLSDFVLYWSNRQKHFFKSFKSDAVQFDKKPLLVHPYILGVWLGDGYAAGARLSADYSSLAMIDKIVSLGQPVNKHNTKYSWGLKGNLQSELKELGLTNNKHIPEDYLTSSIEDRLELLAGLIDTDGNYSDSKNMYEFSQKDEEITDQFIRLCASLGFRTTKGKQKNNKFGNCFRVWVSGKGLECIPVALDRKRARPREQIKDALRYETNIDYIGIGDYYGFKLSGNQRFILGNFIVTHNSGKSTLFRELVLHLLSTTDDMIGIISLEESPAETARRLSGMYLKINTSEVDVPIHKLKEGFDAVFGSNRILLLDHQGSVNDSKLLDMIEYMALMGCGYIFLDHITLAVSEGANGLTGNEAVDSVMASLLSQVKRHNPWLGVISHLRKSPAGGKSFEEGIMPSLDDIKGSGSIKQICFQIIGFARNQVSEEPLDRSTVKFSVLKNRFSGLTGPACITYYDIHTGRYQAEIPSEVFEVETPFDIDKDDNEQLAIEQIAFEACYRDYYLE